MLISSVYTHFSKANDTLYFISVETNNNIQDLTNGGPKFLLKKEPVFY